MMSNILSYVLSVLIVWAIVIPLARVVGVGWPMIIGWCIMSQIIALFWRWLKPRIWQ